ncbi:MAG: thymidylate kinase [Bacilli bacterium]|nr:thymidylate kinase [Bacilli bacterium]
MNIKKLIVMEGACDGIGKTTQFNLLKNKLIEENHNVISHHFPSYNTYQGVPVEKYLNGEYGSPKELSPYFINSLYALDRAITWKKDLKEKYENNNTILLDRYTTSSIIYQSSLIEDIEERKKFIDYVCDFEYKKLEIKEPDQVIFLYAPFDVVTKLRNKRKTNEGIINDIHERDLTFMKKVYDNAMFVAEYLNWDMVNCSKNDEMDSIENIHKKVYQKVKSK